MNYEIRLGWDEDSVLIGEYSDENPIQDDELEREQSDLEEAGEIPMGDMVTVGRDIQEGFWGNGPWPIAIGYEIRVKEI